MSVKKVGGVLFAVALIFCSPVVAEKKVAVVYHSGYGHTQLSPTHTGGLFPCSTYTHPV